MIMLFYLLLTLPMVSHSSQFQSFLGSTPQEFGLIIIVQNSDFNFDHFRSQINKYASMTCFQISEISLVLPSSVNLDQQFLKEDISWKRPIYFHPQTTDYYDLLMLPQKSNARLYFSISFQVQTTCDELKASFLQWKQRSVGDIGPLMSYQPVSYDFIARNQLINYQNPQDGRFIALGQLNAAWVPRFFIDIYNSNKISEAKKIKEHVKTKNSCANIGIYFLAHYFFSQLEQVSLSGDLVLGSSLTNENAQIMQSKSQCLKKFVQILGYNPLRLISRAEPPNSHKFKSKVKKMIIYLKRKQIQINYLSSLNAAKIEKKQKMEMIQNSNLDTKQEARLQIEYEQLDDELFRQNNNFIGISYTKNRIDYQIEEKKKQIHQQQLLLNQMSSDITSSINIIAILILSIGAVFIFSIFILIKSFLWEKKGQRARQISIQGTRDSKKPQQIRQEKMRSQKQTNNLISL